MPLEYNIARNTLSLREDASTNQYRFSVNKKESLGLFTGKTKALKSFLEDEKNHKREITSIIDTGTCGALNPLIKIGTVILSEQTLVLEKEHVIEKYPLSKADHKIPLTAPLSNLKPITTLTLSEPLDNINARDKIYRKRKISICNMESAKIFEIANNLKLKTISVRVVSDWCEGKSLRIFKKSALAHLPKLYKMILESIN